MIEQQIGILAGNHQIFCDLVRKLQLKNSECVYVHDPANFMGRGFDRLIITCLFWQRKDAGELFKATIIRLKPGMREEYIKCCEE